MFSLFRTRRFGSLQALKTWQPPACRLMRAKIRRGVDVVRLALAEARRLAAQAVPAVAEQAELKAVLAALASKVAAAPVREQAVRALQAAALVELAVVAAVVRDALDAPAVASGPSGFSTPTRN
jgi:hypothetical protein